MAQIKHKIRPYEKCKPYLTSFNFVGCSMVDVIIIVVYYCQDSMLFHEVNKENLFSKDVHDDFMDLFISLITRMNWAVLGRLSTMCVTKGATAVLNQVLAMTEAPKIVLLLAVLVIIWHFVIQYKVSSASPMNESRYAKIGQVLCHGMFLALLITYQGHVVETGALLKCVSFGDQSVLFIDGSITCTQPWQYFVYLYLGLWLAPFFLILICGAPLLIGEQISETRFVLLCLFPLPASLFLIIQLLVGKIRGTLSFTKTENEPNSNVMASFFQNSQRNLPFVLEFICCHGVIVALRFTLVLMYTYNDDVINAMLGMLLVVFVKQMYTLLALPYSSLR